MKMRALSILALLLSSTSMASPPEAKDGADAARETAEVIVQKKLLRPLAMKEVQHSKFSRARLPPQERRLRLQQAAVDASGATFFTFAIDDRHGFAAADEDWSEDAITGCVYPERTAVFVKRGDEHRPAELLLGKKTKPAPAGTCTAAPSPTSGAATTTAALTEATSKAGG